MSGIKPQRYNNQPVTFVEEFSLEGQGVYIYTKQLKKPTELNIFRFQRQHSQITLLPLKVANSWQEALPLFL